MGNHPFKKFVVSNLWGEKNYTLKFNQRIIILLGENGTGKTTVLSMFYYLLRGDMKKLAEYRFDRIELHLKRGKRIVIDRKALDVDREQVLLDKLRRYFGPNEIMDLWMELSENIKISPHKKFYNRHSRISNILRHEFGSEEETGRTVLQLANYFNKFERPEDAVRGFLMHDNQGFMESFKVIGEIKEQLKEFNSFDILFFPTYRKVELESADLGIKFEKNNIGVDYEQVIEFGMEDVKKRFSKLLDEIRENTLKAYKGLNEEFLKFLITKEKTDQASQLLNIYEIDILLSRLSGQIDSSLSSRIKDLFSNESIYNAENADLYFFLTELHKVYEKDKEKESNIEKFVDICNKYFVDKTFVFNKGKLTLDLQSKGMEQSIDLKDLSSGEKQIVTMFSKLYLNEPERPKIVLIDEPELSLSIKWQENFLSDVLLSTKCALLFCVTHSPFITKSNDIIESLVNINQIKD